ncbi:DUF1444 domain-containing protein [Desertibacillus haloalkaliphilus]|uniref:DUF1444 domain-containing protein n=1 Tax=Desertibacillus haloalkaliphilus TaxID=1328930 RepID=UPI001C26831C|nr:DUF1444 domain-containing protein [Desertibacillus haloalkaliphilus]MBU8905229.1 DUF1444 domain-containing protein [Desertibacillus haloalkaliphilus]
MEIKDLKALLEKRLDRPEWKMTFNKDEETLRVEHKELKKGVTLSLKPLAAKYEQQKEAALDEVVRYVESALRAFDKKAELKGNEKDIFPVIRATSFPTETKDGKELLFEEHTAETRIYYSLDLGDSYTLITKEMLEDEGMTEEKVKEMALFNVRSLPCEVKEDTVAGNTFYFLSSNDGYDASRILNETFIAKMNERVEGQLALAVPHHDVLVFADIKNDQGYDVLAQLAFQFFSQGRVPITALPFLYEDRELEPIFILAQRKPKGK